MKHIFRIATALAALLLAVGLTSCEKKHTHTFSDTYSYDETHHWHEASCEHEETVGYAAHALESASYGIGGTLYTCKDCGYMKTENAKISIEVAPMYENASYRRTDELYPLLKCRLVIDGVASNEWVQLREENIQSYTVANGAVKVNVSVCVMNQDHTATVSLPIEGDDAAMTVSEFSKSFSNGKYTLLRGTVIGFGTTVDANEIILMDKENGNCVGISGFGQGKLAYASLQECGISLFDEVILPVQCIESTLEGSANQYKKHALFIGGDEYAAAVISEGEKALPSTYAVIDSQQKLMELLKTESIADSQYKALTLHGEIAFFLDDTIEGFGFYFADQSPETEEDIKDGSLLPFFSNPAHLYNYGEDFARDVLGIEEITTRRFDDPIKRSVDITVLFIGGNREYAQFIVLK